MAFKDGVLLGPVSINATGAATTQINGVVNIGTDNASNAITIGTGTSGRTLNFGRSAAAHTIVFGNTNTTTSVDIASGTGNMLLNSAGTNTLTGTGGVTIQSTNTAMALTSGTGALSISADAANTTVNVATGVGIKTTTLGSTNSTSATTVQSGSGALNVTATNGALTINSGTGALGISTDASATTVSFATGAAVKTVTLGSTNSTSATTVQSGTGALNVTSTNGALTINSGTGALSISNDASATTVNIASGGAAKTVQLGSTNGASSLALRYGTSDFTLASATGTVMSALDTGEITHPLQPAFLATHTVDQLNATGNGATVTVNFTTEVFDQNSDYDGTNTFTAPVTGRYTFNSCVWFTQLTAAMTINNHNFVTSNRTYQPYVVNIGAMRTVTGVADSASTTASILADMDAADTCSITYIIAGGAGDTADITAAAANTYFSGFLSC